LPGGFADLVLGPFADPATKPNRGAFGLDQPVFVQFFSGSGPCCRATSGCRWPTKRCAHPVRAAAARNRRRSHRQPHDRGRTGRAAGCARRRATGSGKQGTAVRLLGAFGISVPESVIATALIFIFSYWSLGLRVGGYVPFWQDPWGNILVMTLPTVSLGILIMSVFIRVTRDS
jgi:peptide/nickel transport system permease protein